jgi:uncharacterized membrane protein
MAGIGFELRKLLRRDDLLGVLQSYAHSALTATGPWLLTILMLSGTVFLGGDAIDPDELAQFRLIVIYNFAFSLVFAGPPAMVATRYLADAIYVKRVDEAPSLMLGYLTVLLALEAPLVIAFYVWVVDVSDILAVVAIGNFFVVTGIWLVTTFLSALKDYGAVTRAFAFGTGLALISAWAGTASGSAAAMLAGFSTGLALIFFLLLARVYAEYPYPAVHPFRYGSSFSKYWELAVSGAVYNSAIWVDKWVMWFAPEREQLASGMVSYPDYDSAMFLAYLTIVPSIAAFVLTVETDFFESYQRFYARIQQHASYETIDAAHRDIIASILRGARTFVVLQGSICVATILLAPRLFTVFNINFAQIGMFRIGVLGAFFHVLSLALSITLSYFDLRRQALWLQGLFLVANGVLTWLFMALGPPYYGYGYFLSALITFAATFLVVAHYVGRLPYQTFVVSNTSVTA